MTLFREGSSLSALRHRNFRLLWGGQLVSMVGSMMQNATVLWHVSTVVEQTPQAKALALAMVGLFKFTAIVGFSLFAGVVADALDRRKLMLATQIAMAICAALLAWLAFRGIQSPWPIYVLTALTSAAGVFDGPARQAMIPSLVPISDLGNAISLNAIVFHASTVVGPALAGNLMQFADIGWVYVVNAFSFLAVIGALLAMRGVGGASASAERRSDVSLRSALEGLRFVFGSSLIRSSMLLDFFATFFSSAKALLPIFAQDVLGVGESGYGYLYSAEAVGALATSAVLVRAERAIDRRGEWLLWAVALYGLATVGFGCSTSFWLSFACLAVGGAADTVSMVLRNIIRQTATPDHLRGRMTSVNMIFFMGGPQLGEFEAGLVAQWLGAPVSVITGGVGCLIATAWTAWSSPDLRAYRRSRSER